MKVSLLCRRPIEGFYSLESYFERICRSLLELGVDVDVNVSPYVSQGLRNRLKIIRFAREHQAEITHISGDIHFAALGTDPARTVVTVHDCGRLHQLRGLPREVLRQFWFQQPLQRAAAVTVTSDAVKEDLLRWVPRLDPRRLHVVPVCISPQFTYAPAPFNRSHPRILQVGTSANKNIPRLVEALHGLEVTLVLIGRLTAELKQLLAEQQIRYENHCGIDESEVLALYRTADLVAFASTLEGFGMPILEAQAVGRPVLTSNCTSMPAVAGDAAVLVDPTSVASIREGLLRLIEDDTYRNELIARGRQNVKRFDSQAIAQRYLDVYHAVLRGL
jgi:glycosyltransferase involved in cell wall biosynthesis